MSNKQVSVLSQLRVVGAITLDSNQTDFPPGKLGQFLLKDNNIYAYVTIGNVEAWYPVFQNLSNAYVHTQAVPALTWTVKHNLGSDNLIIYVSGPDGNPIYEESRVTSEDKNTTTLTFTEAETGTAIVIGPNSVTLNNINASLLTVGDVSITTAGIKIAGQDVLTADQLSAAVNAVVNASVNAAISSLKDNVPSAGDTLNKLYSLIQAIETTLTANDTDLNTIQEIIDRIKSDEGLLGSLTTGKVNVSDVVNNLTSTSTTQPLSAAQGKALNDLLTTLTGSVSALQGASQGDTVQKLGTLTANTNINYANGSYVTMTIAAALALTFSGVPDNTHVYALTLKITNGGAFALTWPNTVTWLNSVALKSAGVNLVTLITEDGGATWIASAI